MPQNLTIIYGSHNAPLLQGWMSQPDARGSIDILWSCIFTVFLSSWSVLCLNLPARDEGWWQRTRRKLYWVLLTVMGPEIIFQLSLGEWLLARKGVRLFKRAGYDGWTMTHSFYANMGGLILTTPDQGAFPINAAQLHYLLVKGHIEYPAITRGKILDKNKAEAIIRCLTAGQILWFLVSCIARLQQGLALTIIELSTLAFVFSAVGSFFCWYHKPMDVELPDTLELKVSIDSIQREAPGVSADSWHRTPLDFIDQEREWPWNLYWQCGLKYVRYLMRLAKVPWLILHRKHRPVDRFPDDYWPAPTFKSLPVMFVFQVGYAAILVAGWNLHLPTYTELLLWRIATLIQIGTIMLAWLTIPLMMKDTPKLLQQVFSFVNDGREKFTLRRQQTGFAQNWYSQRTIVNNVMTHVESTRSMLNTDPDWRISVRLLVVYQIAWWVYFTSRLYIVAEDIVSMRALPATAFVNVDWTAYWPHI